MDPIILGFCLSSTALTYFSYTVVDVEERKLFVPQTPWAADPKLKRIGIFQMKNVLEFIQGGGWKMLRASGMEPDRIDQLQSEVATEVMDRRNHSYSYTYVLFLSLIPILTINYQLCRLWTETIPA
jgi:hypothetical protein